MICPNQPLHCDAYSRLGSAGDPLTWYISHPAKWRPLTSQRSRLPSDVRTNAPLRVPTNSRTPLISYSFPSFAPVFAEIAFRLEPGVRLAMATLRTAQRYSRLV